MYGEILKPKKEKGGVGGGGLHTCAVKGHYSYLFL
jgi:hypothetical protein